MRKILIFLLLSIVTSILLILSWLKIRIHLLSWKNHLILLNESLDQKVQQKTKALREERERALQLSRLTAVGEVAGQIAHEMNTPLGSIILLAGMLKKKASSGKFNQSTFESQLDLILKVSKKLSSIIDSVRRLSKGGASEKFADERAVSLIDDAVLLCEGKLKRHSIELKINCEINKETRVICHPTEIGQVLVNLFNNSVDALKDLPITDRWLRVCLKKNKERVEFSISDSGKGIPDEVKDKIFDPKFSTKSLAEGTGFGLALSKKIISKHKGDLYLDRSKENTTFVFNLPLSRVS